MRVRKSSGFIFEHLTSVLYKRYNLDTHEQVSKEGIDAGKDVQFILWIVVVSFVCSCLIPKFQIRKDIQHFRCLSWALLVIRESLRGKMSYPKVVFTGIIVPEAKTVSRKEVSDAVCINSSTYTLTSHIHVLTVCVSNKYKRYKHLLIGIRYTYHLKRSYTKVFFTGIRKEVENFKYSPWSSLVIRENLRDQWYKAKVINIQQNSNMVNRMFQWFVLLQTLRCTFPLWAKAGVTVLVSMMLQTIFQFVLLQTLRCTYPLWTKVGVTVLVSMMLQMTEAKIDWIAFQWYKAKVVYIQQNSNIVNRMFQWFVLLQTL